MKPGNICWLEIPCRDFSKAQHFYGTVFGWSFTPEALPSPVAGIESVHMFNNGDRLNGAFLLMEDDESCIRNASAERQFAMALLPTLYVESIEETAEKVEKAGGRIHVPKTPIPGMGFFARMLDGEGNMIGLFAEN